MFTFGPPTKLNYQNCSTFCELRNNSELIYVDFYILFMFEDMHAYNMLEKYLYTYMVKLNVSLRSVEHLFSRRSFFTDFAIF